MRKENKIGNIETLAGAIYSMLRRYSPVKRTRRINNSGWFRFPNTKSFEIHIQNHVPELKDEDILKRFTPILKFDAYANKRMNRYLRYNVEKLESLRDNPEKYFKIVQILMKNSYTFRAAAISQVYPTWYKDIPLFMIIKWHKKVSKIIKNWDDNLDYSRVYIPKASSDQWRPLGVPTPEWRIVLHMWNNFLYTFLEKKFSPSQHGCMPNRGTLTAWKEFMIKKIYKKKYIYEIDLKKFFDGIHINSIEEKLLSLKVPKRVTYYLMNLAHCLPKLPDEHKLDESRITRQEEDRQALREGSPLSTESKMLNSYKEFVQANGQALADQLMKEDGCESPEEWVQLQWALLDSYKPAKVEGHSEAVPQGAAISPTLSNLGMVNFLQQKAHIAYVDDAFFYSNAPFKIYDQPENGIVIHPEKSGWVKRAGKWEKPLKFLGLEFDGKKFSAKTRKGSRLIYAKNVASAIRQIDIILESLIKERYIGTLEIKNTWDQIFKSKYIGWVQARLYEGNWNPKIIQNFELKFGNGSWGELKGAKHNAKFTLANTSSYAIRSLVNLLRYADKRRYLRRSEALKISTRKSRKK
jgi:hypothetical protein